MQIWNNVFFLSFLSRIGNTWQSFFQKGEHLDRTDEVQIIGNKKKEKLIETYEALPVIGEGVVVEVDQDGEITGIC